MPSRLLGTLAAGRAVHADCLAVFGGTDPLSSRYTDSSFATIFDPSITTTNLAGSGLGRPSDGAVPLSSASLGVLTSASQCASPYCFDTFAHGSGTRQLVGASYDLVEAPALPVGPVVSREVEMLLNTPVYAPNVWIVK